MIRVLLLVLTTLMLVSLVFGASIGSGEHSMQLNRVKRETPEKYPQFEVKAALTYVLPVEDEAGNLTCPPGSKPSGRVCLQMQEPN